MGCLPLGWPLSVLAVFLFQFASLPAKPQPAESKSSENVHSRAQWIHQQKLEKKDRIRKEGSGGFGKAAGWLVSNLKLTDGLEDRKHEILVEGADPQGFYPILGSLASGAGLSLGAGYLSPALPEIPLSIDLSIQYSFSGYELYGFKFGKLPISDGALDIEPVGSRLTSQLEGRPSERGSFYYTEIRYKHFPQEAFFGFGPDSSQSDETDYLLRGTSIDGVLGYQITPWLSTSLRAGYLTFDIGEGTDDRVPGVHQSFDQSLPGLQEEPDFFRFGSGLQLDYRNDSRDSRSGGMVGFFYAMFDDRGNQTFDFHRYLVDVRQFLPLLSNERTLALRFLTQIDSPRSDSRVPFYLRGTLGGSDTLRGYSTFRFRDRNVLHFTAEYRWQGTPGLGLILFYDTGKVLSDLSDFDLSNLKNSFGTGARFKLWDSMVMRFDVGFGSEGPRVILALGQTF